MSGNKAKWIVTKTWPLKAEDDEQKLLSALRQQGLISGNNSKFKISTEAGQHWVWNVNTKKLECQLTPAPDSPGDIPISNFGVVASQGAMYELRLRLLGAKIDKIQKGISNKRLFDVETEVFEMFKAHLTDDDKNVLQVGRQIRNELFHGDFIGATTFLNRLPRKEPVKPDKGVMQMELATGKVTESGNDPDDIYGNLLAGGTLLAEAMDVFRKMIIIVTRLSYVDTRTLEVARPHHPTA